MTSQPKKKRRGTGEMYSSNVGSPSTAHGTCISTPFGKECAHPRALLWAARRRLSKTDISTHNDSDVPYRTQLTLLTRLKDQSKFTQMAYLGGENGGGMEARRDVLRSACRRGRCPRDRMLFGLRSWTMGSVAENRPVCSSPSSCKKY